jgi:hypothetical protein
MGRASPQLNKAMKLTDTSSAWDAQRVADAHALYTELTGQALPLHLERQRQWAQILAHGYGIEDVRQLIHYLQREIRAGHRNPGALKLSNLLQLDRFEEDLALARLRLRPPPPPPPREPEQPTTSHSPEEEQAARERALEILRKFRETLR